MKSSTKNDQVSQADTDHLKKLKVSDVESLLKKDLHTCMLMLQSIHDDPYSLTALATALHGSFMNKMHQKFMAEQEQYENSHRD